MRNSEILLFSVVVVTFAVSGPGILSADDHATIWIAGVPTTFTRIEEKGVIVNTQCVAATGELACVAGLAGESASLAGLSRNRNLKEQICQKLSGRVVKGQDVNKRAHPICVFGDNSMVMLGSLYRKAIENDARSKKAAESEKRRGRSVPAGKLR